MIYALKMLFVYVLCAILLVAVSFIFVGGVIYSMLEIGYKWVTHEVL